MQDPGEMTLIPPGQNCLRIHSRYLLSGAFGVRSSGVREPHVGFVPLGISYYLARHCAQRGSFVEFCVTQWQTVV
jgi:hypothetical protein